MNKLEQARELVRSSTLPPELADYGADDEGSYADPAARFWYFDGDGSASAPALTPEVLASSLHHFVDVETRPITDESAVELGASKYHGLPHLPAGVEWPEGQYLAAQIDLALLSAHDIEGVLPDRGVLYLFFNSAADCTVLHHTGPTADLVVTPYPDPSTLPHAKYYLKDFLKSAARISFRARYIFYVGSDAYDYRDIKKLIPTGLRDQLDELLGCTLSGFDPSIRIFGRPHYWQGEDERWGDGDGVGDGIDRQILLFQDEFGEGNVHFWINATDARKGDFSSAWLDYSGT